MSGRALGWSAVAVAVATLIGAGPASAQPAGARAPTAVARRKLLLAPLATLGAANRAADVVRTERLLMAGLRSVGGVELAAGGPASRRSRACDGEVGCLADLGAAAGAVQVVFGELGGLGETHVVYLKLVDVAARKELRSTTLELGAGASEVEARAAATRLLDPARYRGTLTLRLPVAGSTVYVDGVQVRVAAGQPIALAVGDHALRVTHPEHRDFVRFVDIGFGVDRPLSVSLEPFAVVDREMARRTDPVAPPAAEVRLVPAPWYRSRAVIAGGGVIALVASALVVGALVDGVDADRRRDVR